MGSTFFMLVFLSSSLVFASGIKTEVIENFEVYEDATIHFLDGTSVRGNGKIVETLKIYKIKFKVSERGDVSTWDEFMVKGITMHRQFGDEVYHYVPVMHKSIPSLLKVIELGDISVYLEERMVYETHNFQENQNNSMLPSFGGITRQEKIELFLMRKKDEKASNLEAVMNFKKAALEFFEDCPGLVERIKDRTYGRGDSLEMAYYYNDFCTEL